MRQSDGRDSHNKSQSVLKNAHKIISMLRALVIKINFLSGLGLESN